MILTLVNLRTGTLREDPFSPVMAAIGERLRPRLQAAFEDMASLADEGDLAAFRFCAAREGDAVVVTMTHHVEGLCAAFIIAHAPNPAAWALAKQTARDMGRQWGEPPPDEPAAPWVAAAYACANYDTCTLRSAVGAFRSFLGWAWLAELGALEPETLEAS